MKGIRGVGGGRGRSQGGGGGGGGDYYPPRLDDRDRVQRRSSSGWGVAPPSRHLWVGNLGPHVNQNSLYEQFLRFGDIDNISYIPGRSFAFVNFKREDDAIIALRGLQGLNLSGIPLRIEFAKGDRASGLPQGEEHLHYNDSRQTLERGDSVSRRDLRPQRPSPEKPHEKSKGNRSTEPSEMLWIGFPSFMNVDEVVLRRAFSPFGEIDKIITFPGRTYAFVRFKTILAACRAKEALQGKLFNNPRVSICFARGDNSAEQGREPGSGPYPQHVKSNYHPGLSGPDSGDTFQRERSIGSPFGGEFHMASPGFVSNLDRMSGDSSITGFGRNSSVRTSAVPGFNFSSTFEHGRLQELRSERRMIEDPYEHHRDSPAADRPAPWLDFSFDRTRKAPPAEDPWRPESGSFSLAKKLKTDPFPDNELPEYPFSDFEKEKHNPGLPKLFPGLPDQPTYNKGFDAVPFGFKEVPDPSRNIARPFTESNDLWGNLDGPGAVPGSSLQKFNLEPQQPPLSKEWKWEGTIAKGGTAVCRARCFPVGKVLDFMLPEFLDCTARTGLDMLAKHYYQAASSWVVFFVPQTDADMGFYNEFMHYLGEKQRAAVAKLGEKVSLFLVPPSDFSEQVLKVPGKVSISGVILKFQQPSSSFSSLDNPMEAMESKPPSIMSRANDGASFHGGISFPKPSSPDFRSFSQGQSFLSSSSGHAPPVLSSFPPSHKPVDNFLPRENLPDFLKANRHDQFQHHNPPVTSHWSSNTSPPNPTPGTFPPAPNAVSRSFDNSKAEEHPPLNPRVPQGMASRNYTSEASAIVPLPASKFPQQQQEAKPQVTSSIQLPLHPEQLAQLAALLGQQKQLGNPSLQSGDSKQSNLPQTPSSQSQTTSLHAQALSHAPQALVGPQVSQTQQLQQPVHGASTVQHPVENPVQQSSQQASNSSREETEADPQKRLQATLQLAAALLQQIQQQAKT